MKYFNILSNQFYPYTPTKLILANKQLFVWKLQLFSSLWFWFGDLGVFLFFLFFLVLGSFMFGIRNKASWHQISDRVIIRTFWEQTVRNQWCSYRGPSWSKFIWRWVLGGGGAHVIQSNDKTDLDAAAAAYLSLTGIKHCLNCEDSSVVRHTKEGCCGGFWVSLWKAEMKRGNHKKYQTMVQLFWKINIKMDKRVLWC